ncbi:MAG TPA: NfeD family protein [Dehalococcoidales bacterium]|nr:NfeD family protein [Dehalococcoidales bacterium]
MGKLTRARLVLAIISTSFEEVAIWAIWRWLLPEFGIKLPYQALIGVMAAWAAFGVWLFIFTTRTLRKQVLVGLPSMIGTMGKVVSRLSPEGMVRIKGELWGATSTGGDIDVGEQVMVVGEDGLKLSVRRVGDSRTTH